MIYAVTGSNDFLREREVKSIMDGFDGSVFRLDGKDVQSIKDSLTYNPFFDSGNKLVVLDNPDSSGLFEHCDGDFVDILIHLDYDPKQNTNIGKFVSKLGKNHHNYPAPKDYDFERFAIDFCMQEAKSYGKTLDLNMSTALVRKLGSKDLGFFSFEIMKMCILADTYESEVLNSDIIRGGMAFVAEAMINSVVDALIHKSTKKLSVALDNVRKGSKEDPTMKVCIFLDNAVSRLLVVVDANKKGISPEKVCEETGINLWFYKNKLMIQSSVWTVEELTQLMKVIAESKRSVLSGAVSPWMGLVSRLLQFTN